MIARRETALITGGSAGIGYEIAKILGSMGCDLVLASNERDRLNAIKREFEKKYRIKVTVIAADLARQDAAARLYGACRRKRLTVDVLVNNAGTFFFCEAVMADSDRAMRLMNLHIITPSMLCALFGRGMKERRHGYILNVASISGYRDFPGISFYGSSKRYLRSFTKSLRCEMKKYNVKVTCLSPGATAT